MAVNYAAALTITKAGDLVAPGMHAEPLATAMLNANSLFRTHQPPLVSVCPIHDKAGARALSVTVPIVPSMDGIRYQVLHLLLPEYNGNLTVQVESGNGDPTAWTVLAGPAVQATAANVWLSVQQAVTIAAGEDRLRFSYLAPGGVFLASHVLVWPDPDPALPPLVAPYAQQPSGFWPADDALLTPHGPVHTEMLDRCYRNAIAVLRDRWQCVATFAQDDEQFGTSQYRAPFATVPAANAWALVGRTRAVLPHQSAAPMGGLDMRPALRVACQGAVTAGVTNDRLRVVARATSGKEAMFMCPADGAQHVEATQFRVDLDGSPDAAIDVEFWVRADAGQVVSFRNAALHWRPGS